MRSRRSAWERDDVAFAAVASVVRDLSMRCRYAASEPAEVATKEVASGTLAPPSIVWRTLHSRRELRSMHRRPATSTAVTSTCTARWVAPAPAAAAAAAAVARGAPLEALWWAPLEGSVSALKRSPKR